MINNMSLETEIKALELQIEAFRSKIKYYPQDSEVKVKVLKNKLLELSKLIELGKFVCK
jgi:hypothetical protein